MVVTDSGHSFVNDFADADEDCNNDNIPKSSLCPSEKDCYDRSHSKKTSYPIPNDYKTDSENCVYISIDPGNPRIIQI